MLGTVCSHNRAMTLRVAPQSISGGIAASGPDMLVTLQRGTDTANPSTFAAQVIREPTTDGGGH
jgi:hypothetical protein